MIVLDASVVVSWLLRDQTSPAVDALIADNVVGLHAPQLLVVEVAQVVRRYAATRQITPERADQAITDFGDLDINLHPHEPLLPIVWQLRHNLTVYDAVYVALALALDASLITLDAAIAAAPAQRAKIELIR